MTQITINFDDKDVKKAKSLGINISQICRNALYNMLKKFEKLNK